jgi:hypothetical protein
MVGRIRSDVDSPYVRVMIHEESESSVYLFLYKQTKDGPCDADYWYASTHEARSAAHDDFGVDCNSWQEISDRKSGCQQDWIADTCILRDKDGVAQWGKFVPLADQTNS